MLPRVKPNVLLIRPARHSYSKDRAIILRMPIRDIVSSVSRIIDHVTDNLVINIDHTHSVPGDDPRAFVRRLAERQRLISPLQVDVHQEQGETVGQVFPLGPTVGFSVLCQETKRLKDGRLQTVAIVRYSHEFSGRGRITVTQDNGYLRVRDQWLSVENHSDFPTASIELAHSAIVHHGFVQVAREAIARP